MWANNDGNVQAKRFFTPPATWRSPRSPMPSMPMSERRRADAPACKGDIFHVIHKVPAGDSPYVRAKHVQLIDKDPSRAISMFWSAINAGDRVDSALKDMAVVMKQLNRSDEAIEAIKSFRHLCPSDSQESLDNVLIELYKRCGRIEEEIQLLQQKLKNIEEGITFGGKRTKIARSQGKKIQITVSQEKSRVLGNLAWAYLQQHNYGLAEQHYRKALSLELDKNKQCNLAICLMHMNKFSEAKSLLQAVEASSGSLPMDDSYAKSFERAIQMLTEFDSQSVPKSSFPNENDERYLTLPTTNGDQGHVSGFVESGRWKGHDEERILSVDSNLRNSSCVECYSGRPRFPSEVKEEDTVPTHAHLGAFTSPALYTQPRRSWNLSEEAEKYPESLLPRDLRILPRRTDAPSQERNISEVEPVSQPTMKSHRKLFEGYDDAFDHTMNKDVRNGQETGKKTWADMVEEDEHEGELNQMFDGLNMREEEEFKDENLNGNIIHQSCGRAGNAGLSKYPTVRRSLTFEDGGVKNTKRRSRLQVFRDITPSPDSP